MQNRARKVQQSKADKRFRIMEIGTAGNSLIGTAITYADRYKAKANNKYKESDGFG